MIPELSVLTPSYNDGAFVHECIESVRKAATAAGIDVRHIVVDDGSTDNTAAILTAATDVWSPIHCENQGASAALNTALRHAAGSWCLILAADDAVTEHAFVDWQAAAQRRPDANVIYSDLELFGTRGGFYTVPPFDSNLMRQRNVLPGAAFVRTDLLRAVGGFDPDMRTAQDWDFWVRADLAVGLVPVRLPFPAVRYRFHATPRLHNESARNIETIRQRVRGRTRETAILTHRELVSV
jgi:glycosyltransferase involved in cell wall biosynthesis